MKTSNKILVSTFKGFSKHLTNNTLQEKLAEIYSGKHLIAVEKIRLLTREEKTEEAARIKRQLPGFTLSAIYRERRVPEMITGYNDLLILDLDKLNETELISCREAAEKSPYTLFIFKSPSGNGLKLGVHFRSEETDTLRESLFSRTEITFEALEKFHKQQFNACCKHYEALCKVAIDPSGSDIGRLCFTSYDPEIYINTEAINRVEPPQLTILPPKKATQPPKPNSPHHPTAMQMEFHRCLNSVKRNMKYVPGQRNTFLYTLGNKCYRKGLSKETTIALAELEFGREADINIPEIIHNAYQYTSHTNQQEEEKKKLEGIKIAEFLEKEYEVRRNVVLERLEYRKRADSPQSPFVPVRHEDLNTIFLDAQYAGIPCRPNIVKAVVDSRIAHYFNPFEDYFYTLPPWDGITDHIETLAQTVKTNNQTFWCDCFKRWLVAMVVCALDDEKENQLALIIKGPQGKGKSTWIRHLLPHQLKQYYRNGMIAPNNKDHMLFLSQRLIINLEEFEGMKKQDIADLKRLITQDMITERKAYGENANVYVRRCSFIASTNEPRFLEDITGTRRFPTITAEEIDYHTPVDHTGIYAQAMHLWKNGFRYWYEEKEFQELNKHNKQYVVASAEEELFYVYFRKPTPEDLSVKWMPANAILTQLVIYGKIHNTSRNTRTLIKVLERDGFQKRISANNIYEYEVVQISVEDIERNFKTVCN